MVFIKEYKYYIFFVGLLAYLFSGSCFAQHKDYTFFVAGHVYGTPNEEIDGLFPPFLNHLTLNSEQYNFGVFTGDIVRKPTQGNWETIQKQLQLISTPIYFAPGNHDMGNRNLYKELNGIADTCFTRNEDVFLIFDNTKYGWNLDSMQTQLFKKALSSLSVKSRLFIFGHNVLWQDKYECSKPNSLEGKGPTNEFWINVFPELLKISNPVYWFAGDVGATESSKNISYINENNVHLITSGMGNNINDNYLKVSVTHTDVSIDVISLNKNSTQPITNFICN
jgi:hypothetical protein